MNERYLTVLPVFNEAETVRQVVDAVKKNSQYILVVDDGSSDETSAILKTIDGIQVLTHEQNLGYGAALTSGFDYAIENNFQFVVTIDCDGQHEPQRIPNLIQLCQKHEADIVSGSRYLQEFNDDTVAPEQRRHVNQLITEELNQKLGLQLTDAFCGFKAYRVNALKKLSLSETGYAMPLQLWVQAACANLKIIECPVPRIYLDHSRTFGGQLDDMSTRLEYYHLVINRSMSAFSGKPHFCKIGVHGHLRNDA